MTNQFKMDAVDRIRNKPCAGGLHRWFHPLCGCHPLTLLTLLVRNGPPSYKRLAPVAIALASSLGRLPFTLAEQAWMAGALRRAPPVRSPIFIVGHMRSGTTHLHNVLSRAEQFASVPPLAAGMPWEALGLARLIRPLIEPYFPEHRLIDAVPIERDSPTEDEIALANMASDSIYHALYFPRCFRRNYERALFLDDRAPHARLRRQTVYNYVRKMSLLNPGKPLLLKNPAYSTQVAMLRAVWPAAKFIHIYRNPYSVFASSKHTVETVLRELSLQSYDELPIADVILDAYPRIMTCLLDDTAELPAESIVSVRFEDLETAPLATIERVYTTLGLGGFSSARPRIANYLNRIRHYRKNQHRLAPADIERVSRHWGSYVARWDYREPDMAVPTAEQPRAHSA